MYSKDKHILIADRAYEDKQMRTIMKEQGFIPVVPRKIVNNHGNMTRSCINVEMK